MQSGGDRQFVASTVAERHGQEHVPIIRVADIPQVAIRFVERILGEDRRPRPKVRFEQL